MPSRPDSIAHPFERDPIRPPRRAPVTPVRQVAVTVQVVNLDGAPPFARRVDLRRPWPNPATSATLLRFSCAESGPVTITVYSVFGQRVATPVRGSYLPGEYEVRWSTTDDRGRRLQPGMYVIRMAAGRAIRTQKLAITP